MPALQDLQKLLLVQPANIQARLTQATILQVIGNYEEAEKSCYSLIDNQEPLVPITCFSSIMSLKGQAIKSYDLLLESINNEKNITPEQYFWSYSVLAQIASRLDRVAEADEFFNKALVAINNKDVYVLSAYADFLLAQNKAEKVINLLSANTRSDSLFLRLILAKQQLNYQDLNDGINELKARYAISKQRGENFHQGDEAIFDLFLANQPEQALTLALANWQIQREPKDALIVMQAALAANNPLAAKSVIDWVRQTGLEYLTLNKLLANVNAINP